MSYFELLEQFWQLDAERTIAPAASKLYFYLLNEFNAARPVHWPAKLYRRATQVYADLRIDKKTLPTAVAALEERGLIRHYSGDTSRSGEWQLNYGPAADWAGGMGKNSPQQADNAASYGEKFPTPTPEMAEGMGKNSPPIRNRQDKIRKDQPQHASEGVGEAAEEITTAPLPTNNSELVPPVAEPPHAALGPVAAAELPAALKSEVKALADEMGKMWKFNEQHGFASWQRLYNLARCLALAGKLPELRHQFAGYLAGHIRGGALRPHRLEDWLGDPNHPSGPYRNGIWCSCDWQAVAAERPTRPGEPLPQSSRASTSARKPQTQEW